MVRLPIFIFVSVLALSVLAEPGEADYNLTFVGPLQADDDNFGKLKMYLNTTASIELPDDRFKVEKQEHARYVFIGYKTDDNISSKVMQFVESLDYKKLHAETGMYDVLLSSESYPPPAEKVELNLTLTLEGTLLSGQSLHGIGRVSVGILPVPPGEGEHDNGNESNEDGNESGGDNTSGDNTSSDNTSSDNTSSDNTSSDNTSSDNTSSDNTSGDNTSSGTSEESNEETENNNEGNTEDTEKRSFVQQDEETQGEGDEPMPPPTYVSGTMCSTGITPEVARTLCNMTSNVSTGWLIPYAAIARGPVYLSDVAAENGSLTYTYSSAYNRMNSCSHLTDAGLICGTGLRDPSATDYFNGTLHIFKCEAVANPASSESFSKLLGINESRFEVTTEGETVKVKVVESDGLTADDIFLMMQLTNEWAKMTVANVANCTVASAMTESSSTNSSDDSNATENTTDSETGIEPENTTTNESAAESTSSSSVTATPGEPTSTSEGIKENQVRFIGQNIEAKALKKKLAELLNFTEDDIKIVSGTNEVVVLEFLTSEDAKNALKKANEKKETLNITNAASVQDEGGSNSDDDGPPLVAIIVPVLVGVLLIIVIVVVVLKVRSKDSGLMQESEANEQLLSPPAENEAADKPAEIEMPEKNDAITEQDPLKDNDL